MDETAQTFIPDPIQISYSYINMCYGHLHKSLHKISYIYIYINFM
jgi:hypothetical protein